MAGWAIAFTFNAFITSTVLISLVVILLIFMNIRLAFYYPAKWSQPIDYLFLHTSARLFLLVTATLLLPLCVFISIGHSWAPKDQRAYDSYAWEGFSVIAGSGGLAVIIAAWRHDLVWSIGTIYIMWCIGSARPKSGPVAVRNVKQSDIGLLTC